MGSAVPKQAAGQNGGGQTRGHRGLSPDQRRQLYARGAQPVPVRVRRCVQRGRDRGGQPCEGLVPGCDGHSGWIFADEDHHRGHSAVPTGNYILVPVLHMAGDGGLQPNMGRSGRDDVARVGDVSRGLEDKNGRRDARVRRVPLLWYLACIAAEGSMLLLKVETSSCIFNVDDKC